MKKLVWVLCVLFLAFGVWSCSSDASEEDTENGYNKNSAKIYDANGVLLGTVVNTYPNLCNFLTITKKFFSVTWDGLLTGDYAPRAYFTERNCTGIAIVWIPYPPYTPINSLIYSFNNDYYGLINEMTSPITPLSSYDTTCHNYSYSPLTGNDYYIFSRITPATAGLPAIIVFPISVQTE